jgi:hypothetical protein
MVRKRPGKVEEKDMKVLEQTWREKEIGALDGALYLPMAGRLRAKMKTTCAACRTAITEEFFIGGFKSGMPNLLLHVGCTDPQVVEKAMAEYQNRSDR